MPMIVEISDPGAPQLRPYARLTERQLTSSDDPLFIAESAPVIESALEAGIKPVSLLAARRHVSGKAAGLIRRLGDVPVYTGEDGLLAEVTGFELSRGILCAMRRPAPLGAEDIVPSGSLILLENVTDATNMGAIFRTAAALGAGGILLSPDCCDPLNRRAARVSMGGVFHVPWAFSRAAAWPDDIAARLKAAGFTLIALALREDALSVTDSRVLKAARPALVLGNERRGVTERTLALCDMCAVIPMNNGVDSLNVSHAAAIAMWELIAAPAARRQSP